MELDKKHIEKYQAGKTSLTEERYLHEQALKSSSPLSPTASFITKQSIEAPEGLEERVWSAVSAKAASTKRQGYQRWALAASIAILIVIGLSTQIEPRQSQAEKEALWQEAISMVNKAEAATLAASKILYEDELLVIYLTDD